MSFTKLIGVTATLLTVAVIVATVTTFINVSNNIKQMGANKVPALLPVLENEQQQAATVRDLTVIAETPDSPIDVILAATDQKSAAPMPADQVEWAEVPYPDDTSGDVFAGFGSEDLEAQAEVGVMFDELLEDFALQAQSIDRHAAEN